MMHELEALAMELGQHLTQKQLTLATAESCTAGGLGYWITSVPGSSAWFERGFITYSNQAKIDMLHVKPHTLEKFGAVSEPVVMEMAEGALAHSQADLAVAVSGIAGPDGGSPDKPIGTVWLAYAGKNMRTETYVDIFSGNRETVRLSIIKRALVDLIKLAKSSDHR